MTIEEKSKRYSEDIRLQWAFKNGAMWVQEQLASELEKSKYIIGAAGKTPSEIIRQWGKE